MERRRFLTGTVSVAALTGCLRLSGSDDSGNGNGDSESTPDQNSDSTPASDGNGSGGNGDGSGGNGNGSDGNGDGSGGGSDSGGGETTETETEAETTEADDSGGEETTTEEQSGEAVNEAIANSIDYLDEATSTLHSNVNTWLTDDSVNKIETEGVRAILDDAAGAIQRAKDNAPPRETDANDLGEYESWLRDLTFPIDQINQGYAKFVTGTSEFQNDNFESGVSTLEGGRGLLEEGSNTISTAESNFRALPLENLREMLGDTVSTADDLVTMLVSASDTVVAMNRGTIDFFQGTLIFVNEAAPAYQDGNYEVARTKFGEAKSEYASSIEFYTSATNSLPQEAASVEGSLNSLICAAESWRNGMGHFEDAADAAISGDSAQEQESATLAQQAIEEGQACLGSSSG